MGTRPEQLDASPLPRIKYTGMNRLAIFTDLPACLAIAGCGTTMRLVVPLRAVSALAGFPTPAPRPVPWPAQRNRGWGIADGRDMIDSFAGGQLSTPARNPDAEHGESSGGRWVDVRLKP
jgi:hypothetical protein